MCVCLLIFSENEVAIASSKHTTISPLSFSLSDVNKTDSSFELSRLVIEVWDWDRYTANDLIGGFSIPVPEIVEWSKGGNTVTNWYRLLDSKNLKQKYEHVIDDSEAEKVRRGKGDCVLIIVCSHTYILLEVCVVLW